MTDMTGKILLTDFHYNIAFLDDERKIKVAFIKGVPFIYISEELQQMFLSNGYRALPEIHALIKLVFSFEGASVDDLVAEIAKRGTTLRTAAEHEEQKKALWNQLPEYLRPLIIGIFSLEFYPTGLSVYINLNTSYTFEQQRLLLARGQNGMAEWLSKAFTTLRAAQYRKAARLLPFLRISSWAIARNNQAVYRYELKQRVMDVLSDGPSDERKVLANTK